MIDHIALAIGHGLMAVALLRLVMRAGLDDDPLIGELKSEADVKRKAKSSAGRNAARRESTNSEDEAPRSSSGCEARPQVEPVAHKTPRSSSEAVAHKNA